jgi:hypothetical protein
VVGTAQQLSEPYTPCQIHVGGTVDEELARHEIKATPPQRAVSTIYTISKVLLLPEVWIFNVLSAGCLAAWVGQWSRAARVTLSLVLVLYYGI